MRKRDEGGREVPLIHRSMSVEVARALLREIRALLREIEGLELSTPEGVARFPEMLALYRDVDDVLRQLEAGDVHRPC